MSHMIVILMLLTWQLWKTRTSVSPGPPEEDKKYFPKLSPGRTRGRNISSLFPMPHWLKCVPRSINSSILLTAHGEWSKQTHIHLGASEGSWSGCIHLRHVSIRIKWAGASVDLLSCSWNQSHGQEGVQQSSRVCLIHTVSVPPSQCPIPLSATAVELSRLTVFTSL